MMNRIEQDLLGSVEVPTDVLHGANTQRALNSFPAGKLDTVGDYPSLVEALLRVKWAAAELNRRNGDLDEDVAAAIIHAARSLLESNPGVHFPLCHLHGGGGTAINMNANEVLANSAEEKLGGRRGEYQRVHPNNHVNRHQSTNDVYPTACRMAVISTAGSLDVALSELAGAFDRLVDEMGAQRRLARTCLQDAVETSFGDLFGGYITLIRRSRRRLGEAVTVLHTVNLGGTIVGRPDDAPAAYRESIVDVLREVAGDADYVQAENLYDAAQNPDELLAVSGALELFARGLIKICQDLRLLSSGPEADSAR